MKNLIILGGSGIGMIAASIAELTGKYSVKGFLNDEISEGSSIGKYKKYPVLGSTDSIKKFLEDQSIYFFIAYVGMTREEDIFKKVVSMGIPESRFASLIHPTAVIPKGMCKIGSGILLGPHTQLSPDVDIQDNCILLGGSFLGHDSKMLRFSHLATNSVVGANVTVGRACHIGSNSTVREHVKIGDFSLIGAGSVVLEDVKPGSIIVGNPGKPLVKKVV